MCFDSAILKACNQSVSQSGENWGPRVWVITQDRYEEASSREKKKKESSDLTWEK